MESQSFDVLIAGAGIHGVGTAQAAAAAGHSVCVIEAREVGFGTSSRSSKLIHGGLRYLETGQLRLVRESLKERSILLKLAPDLVRLVPFHIPIYRSTRRRPWQIRIGLSLYALLGGLGPDTRFLRVARGDWDSLDGLKTDGLQAVFRYRDGQTDDQALCRAVLGSAVELGARFLDQAELLGASFDGARWRAQVRRGAEALALESAALVNAAGPWVDRVAAGLQPRPPARAFDLVAGSHIELEGRLERGIYYVEAPSDRRAVFLMPWKGRTLVGTTERAYDGDPAKVAPSDAEIHYLEETLRHYLPAHAGRRLRAFSGLRVLPRDPRRFFERPREVILDAFPAERPALVTILGGKLTGYRHTAERVVALLASALPRRTRIADTQTLRLRAAPAGDAPVEDHDRDRAAR